MDTKIYYFHENNIETATTEINAVGWYRFTDEQTSAYLDNKTLLPYWNGSSYELIDYVPPVFNLDNFKLMKLSDMSNLSLMIKEQKYKSYKYQNAMSSVNMIARNEDPMYSLEVANTIMQEYDSKSKAFRDEYYRLKGLIEVAQSVEEIDTICFNNQFDTI